MAKKVKISENEKKLKENIHKEDFIHKKSKNKLNILFIVLVIVMGIGIVGSIVFYNNKISLLKKNYNTLKKENKNLTKENKRLANENEQIHSNLFSVIGTNSVYYVNDKLDFMDENIVFKIEGFGNYYYTYDCMISKVNGPYTYWAYNKEAAISIGLRAGGCQ